MPTLTELHKTAVESENAIRVMATQASRLAQDTRAKLREIEGRWDLSAESKSTGRNHVLTEARTKFDAFAQTLDLHEKTIAGFVAMASRAPAGGDAGAEARRGRAYNALEAAVMGEQTIAGRSSRFRELVVAAETHKDLTQLEAARELAQHLELRGYDLGPDLPAHLDMLAGPPASRLAREMEARATPGGAWASLSINQARAAALTDPASQATGRLAVGYDRTIFPVDPVDPAPRPPVVMIPGA